MELNVRNIRGAACFVGLLAIGTGCSLGPANDGTKVRISLPERSHALYRTSDTSLSVAPASVSEFDCYGINVVASDIPVEVRIPQCVGASQASSRRAGILAGLIVAGAGSIDLKVSAGKSRTFQLVGIRTTSATCPAIEDVLSGKTTLATSYPYLLAESTVDVQSDATMKMKVSYDPLNPINAMSDCRTSVSGSTLTSTLTSSLNSGGYRLQFARQNAGSMAAGAVPSLLTPSIEIVDSSGSRVTSGSVASSTVRLSTSGVAGQVIDLPATAGLADFSSSGLQLTQAGNARWSISVPSESSIVATLSSVITVSAGSPANTYSRIGTTASVIVGSPTVVTVSVRDAYGNPVVGWAGEFGLASGHTGANWTGGSYGTPIPIYATTLDSNGSATGSLYSSATGVVYPIFSMAPSGSSLTVTVSGPLTFLPGPVASVNVSQGGWSSIPFGQAVTLTATAYDGYGNQVTTLSGTGSYNNVSLAQTISGTSTSAQFESPTTSGAVFEYTPTWSGGAMSISSITMLKTGLGQQFYVSAGGVVGTSGTIQVNGTNLVVPIEMIDQPLTVAAVSGSLDRTRIRLSPDDFDGVNGVMFEAVVVNNMSRTLSLSRGGSDIATLTLVSTSGYPMLQRTSVPFNQFMAGDYYLNIGFAAGASTSILSARILITQANATRTKLYVPLLGCGNPTPVYGLATGDLADIYANVGSANSLVRPVCGNGGPRASSIWKYDPNWFVSSNLSASFVASVGTASWGGTADQASAVLLKSPDGTGWANAATVTNGSQNDFLLLSAPLTLPATSAQYTVSVTHSTASSTTYLAKAGIWINLPRLIKAEIFHRLLMQAPIDVAGNASPNGLGGQMTTLGMSSDYSLSSTLGEYALAGTLVANNSVVGTYSPEFRLGLADLWNNSTGWQSSASTSYTDAGSTYQASGSIVSDTSGTIYNVPVPLAVNPHQGPLPSTNNAGIPLIFKLKLSGSGTANANVNIINGGLLLRVGAQ